MDSALEYVRSIIYSLQYALNAKLIRENSSCTRRAAGLLMDFEICGAERATNSVCPVSLRYSTVAARFGNGSRFLLMSIFRRVRA